MVDRVHMCPHCGEVLECWQPSPESGWDQELFICTNNECSYFVKGRERICEECHVNFACRYCYNPQKDRGIALAAWCGGDLSLMKGRCGV